MMMKTMTFWTVRNSSLTQIFDLIVLFKDEDDTPTGQSAGNVASSSNDDDDDDDYSGLSLLGADVLDDILGGDDDEADEPAPSRKNSKKKIKNSVTQPIDLINAVSPVQNEINNDDDESDEDESGGFLELLDGN